MEEGDPQVDIVKDIEIILCVISLTTLEIFLEIAEHQLIKMDLTKEGVHLYVIYAIICVTLQDFIFWI